MTTPVPFAVLDYTHKPPDLQVVQYNEGITDLQAVADWVNTGEAPGTYTVESGWRVMIVRHTVTEAFVAVSIGHYLAKDQNGNYFTISSQLLGAFYDLVP